MGNSVASKERLARELQSARTKAELSLRSVAQAADISAAYLQKLEQARVSDPSPRILQRLATVLDLSYRRLMESAGYEPPRQTPSRGSALDAKLSSAALTEAEERAVAAFVDHLVTTRSSAKPRPSES